MQKMRNTRSKQRRYYCLQILPQRRSCIKTSHAAKLVVATSRSNMSLTACSHNLALFVSFTQTSFPSAKEWLHFSVATHFAKSVKVRCGGNAGNGKNGEQHIVFVRCDRVAKIILSVAAFCSYTIKNLLSS